MRHTAPAHKYSGTSVIREVWDQGVPATLKLPVTLNLFMNYVRTVHGDMVTWEHVHEAYSASTQVRQTSLVNREQL